MIPFYGAASLGARSLIMATGDQIMPRWKKPAKDEILANRREIAERARTGDLRLPDALVQIRKGLGMTQA